MHTHLLDPLSTFLEGKRGSALVEELTSLPATLETLYVVVNTIMACFHGE